MSTKTIIVEHLKVFENVYLVLVNVLNKDQGLIQKSDLKKCNTESAQRYTRGASIASTDAPLYISSKDWRVFWFLICKCSLKQLYKKYFDH